MMSKKTSPLKERKNLAYCKASRLIAKKENIRNFELKPISAEESQRKIKPSKHGLRRLYKSVNISAEKWLMTMDEKSLSKLENPPSLADGLDRKTEQDLRYLGCEIIQSGSILLRMPQVAAATAQILYQRFYYQRSFVRHDFEPLVMACLLLASKIEEAPKKPREVINVFHRLEHWLGKRNESKNYVPRLLDRNYVDLKNQVIKAERKLLNALGFVVHVNHPHKLIYAYLQALTLLDNQELLQKAWNYMNDGLRTDIFLRYRPETIACACIHLAARTISEPLPLPQQPFPWFEAFDASDRDVRSISLILLKLYSRFRAPNWARMCDALSKLHASSDLNATRLKAGVSKEVEISSEKVVADKKKEDEPITRETDRKNGRDRSKEHRIGSDRSSRENNKESIKANGRNYPSSSSRSRSRSRSPFESRKFHSYGRRHRDSSLDRDRLGTKQSRNRSRHHREHRDDKRRSKDERRIERSRYRSRSRSDLRKSYEKNRNQRERERDIYMLLGNRKHEVGTPEHPVKYR